MRRQVSVKISGEVLARWLEAGNEMHSRVVEGLPSEARLTWAHYDGFTNVVHLVFEHPSFAEVPDGGVVRQFDVVVEEVSA